MSRVDSKVFTDELSALKYARDNNAKIFTAEAKRKESGESVPHYVVAVSEHQAKLALVGYLMPLGKLSRSEQDRRYIAALETAATSAASQTTENESAESPADTPEVPEVPEVPVAPAKAKKSK